MAVSSEEPGFWDFLWQAVTFPYAWPGFLLGLAGPACSWKKGRLDLGVGCLAAGWHYSLGLVTWLFADWVFSYSCAGCTIGFRLEYLLPGLMCILVPMTALTVAALPPILRNGGLRRYLAAFVSVLVGFCAVTLCMFGIVGLLFTPTATLQALVR